METVVITGKLTYVNDSASVIHITDKDEATNTVIGLKPGTNSIDFKPFIGKDIEAILIDGEIQELFLTPDE